MTFHENTQLYFRLGFLPFLKESEQDFCQRCEVRLENQKKFVAYLKENETDKLVEPHYFEPVLSHMEALWKIRPTWPLALFSRQSMSPFHLGALCAQEFNGKDIFFIQLHPRLEKHATYWGYQRDFILLHETIHLLREGLDSGRFEEFVAYDTDPNPLRRFLGPFFSSPWMPAVFMAQLWIMLYFVLAFTQLLAEISPSVAFYINGTLVLALGALSLPWLTFARNSYIYKRLKAKLKLSPWSHLRRLFLLSLHEKDVLELSKRPFNQWPKYLLGLPKDLYRDHLLSVLGLKENL